MERIDLSDEIETRSRKLESFVNSSTIWPEAPLDVEDQQLVRAGEILSCEKELFALTWNLQHDSRKRVSPWPGALHEGVILPLPKRQMHIVKEAWNAECCARFLSIKRAAATGIFAFRFCWSGISYSDIFFHTDVLVWGHIQHGTWIWSSQGHRHPG